jgi:hypothetical protein
METVEAPMQIPRVLKVLDLGLPQIALFSAGLLWKLYESIGKSMVSPLCNCMLHDSDKANIPIILEYNLSACDCCALYKSEITKHAKIFL